MKLFYLGPEGTFTHQAAMTAADQFATLGDFDLIALPDVPAIMQAVQSRQGWGVIAWENNVEGYVVPNLDALIDAPNAAGFARISVDVAFNAFTVRGHSIYDCTGNPVSAHPHGLAQCTRFIAEHHLQPEPAGRRLDAARGRRPHHQSRAGRLAVHRGSKEGTAVVDTVGIVGLGLIGGSLARRLTERGVRVVAWNHRPHPYAQAEADGIFCKSTLSELMDAEPDVVVLCNPLKAMPAILAALAPLMGDHPNTTLTDVGSVKGMVRDQVKAAGLGKCYVGAHPMAGNELSGWQAADPHLYDGALWAITVDESTDYRRFLDVAAMITKDVGNRVIVVDDETHDKAAAMISHMPHVVSTALINELVANPDRNIAAALAAGCWRDMTRVSLTDPDRTRAMVEEDSLNVEALLRRMAARLTDMADQLHAGAAGEQDVMGFFAEGDPFRRYKAAVTHAGITAAQDGTATAAPQAGTTAAGFPERELAVPEAGWQQTLLFSARRGEAITGFVHPRQAIIQLRPAM